MDESTRRLRETFGSVAARYSARPGYPQSTVDELFRVTGVTAGSAVLEIGCGTGQLTVPLARRGLAVTAVELSADLAEIALRNLDGHPDVRMVVAAFEDATLPDAAFDLVVAATSFHWIDPEVRFTKTARVLRPGGALATIYTYHVAGGAEQFFVDVQECYRRWDAEMPSQPLPPAAADAPLDPLDLDTPLFTTGETCRHEWTHTTTAAEYVALLHTFSPVIALPSDRRDGLLACVAELIDTSYGGTITTAYLTELRVLHLR